MRKIVLAEEDGDDETDVFGGRSWDNMKPHPVNKEKFNFWTGFDDGYFYFSKIYLEFTEKELRTTRKYFDEIAFRARSYELGFPSIFLKVREEMIF